MNKNIIENDNIKRSNSKVSNIKGYYRIKNNHIFVQSLNGTESILSFIDEICKDKNQRIHIFDLNPLTITNLIDFIINKGNKVVIYIPKVLRDYEKVLEYEYEYIKDKNWKIQIFSRPIIFRNNNALCDGNSSIKIKCVESDDYFYFITKVYNQENYSTLMPLSLYYTDLHNQCYNGYILRTVLQYKYPELFKDRIIHNFKRVNRNRKEILNSFKNDDEIWNYILENIIPIPCEEEDLDNGVII